MYQDFVVLISAIEKKYLQKLKKQKTAGKKQKAKQKTILLNRSSCLSHCCCCILHHINYYVNKKIEQKKIEQFSYVFNSISPLMFGEC